MDHPPQYMSDQAQPSYSEPRRPTQKRSRRGPPQSAPLFDDTSTQQSGYDGQPTGYSVFNPTQLSNDPMANMAFQYGTSLASQGKDYVDKNLDEFVSTSKLKYYFAVDTSYVGRKLALLLFPFTHQNWSIKYNKAEPIAPRYEINAPDMYIPTMSFVTYVLVAGLVMGTQDKFSPEQLGITATSAFLWSFVEVMAILFSFYICSVMAEIKALDLVAFCGYKYVGIILCLLAGLVFRSTEYYAVLVWMSLTTAFFLVRTLRLIILPEADADSIGRASKRRVYLLLFIALLQPVLMYILTRHLRPLDITQKML
ncbi:protein YIF1B-A-like [Dendronephthya gigantea]|uniref:protein YIF1B-A-like n=1 Tax=Dendronephthya gigantea TaxID=151771 RepID=UPI00106A539E|nr:protein YIF1B-A-like [Dendronephthya gigantea]